MKDSLSFIKSRCLLFVVIIVLSGASYAHSLDALPSPFDIENLRGLKAPDFTLKDFEGNLHRLSFYKGNPVILTFCASWSPVSRKDVNLMHRSFTGANIAVIAISVDRDYNNARAFIQPLAGDGFYPLFDEGAAVARDRYRVFMVPTTIYIDKQGIIQRIYLGMQDWEALRRDMLNSGMLNFR